MIIHKVSLLSALIAALSACHMLLPYEANKTDAGGQDIGDLDGFARDMKAKDSSTKKDTGPPDAPPLDILEDLDLGPRDVWDLDAPLPDVLVPDAPAPDMPVLDAPIPDLWLVDLELDLPTPDLPPPDLPAPDAPVDLFFPDTTLDSTWCVTGLVWCNGQCVNIDTDPQHCSGCDQVCPAPSNPCMEPICSEGSCSEAPKPEGDLCPDGGQCHEGSCCTGCWTGTTCETGTSVAACGIGGNECTECQIPTEPCEYVYCAYSTGNCEQHTMADGSGCPGGQCLGGTCCTGCVLGGACQPGTVLDACGQGGDPCEPCPQEYGCISYTCEPGVGCKKHHITGYTDACSPGYGYCIEGVCCTGCVDYEAGNYSCLSGNDKEACGHSGNECKFCPDGYYCIDGKCLQS